MNLANFVKTKKEQILRRFVKTEVQVIEKIVEVDAGAAEYERKLQEFAAWTKVKYGITYEDLKTDFSPGRILGGPEMIFWEEYRKNTHWGGPAATPYEAREKANVYSHITREEIAKVRKEMQDRVKVLKKLLDDTIKNAVENFYKER